MGIYPPIKSKGELCVNDQVGAIRTKQIPQDQCDARTGNPCIPATGGKELYETDVTVGSVAFGRNYNSLALSTTNSAMGAVWNHTYGARVGVPSNDNGPIQYFNAQGNIEIFSRATPTGNLYQSLTKADRWIRGSRATGWKVEDGELPTLAFDTQGRLTVVSPRDGSGEDALLLYATAEQSAAGLYVPAGRLAAMTDVRGRTLLAFGYAAVGNTVECYAADGEGCNAIRLTTVRLGTGGELTYSYTNHGDVSVVTFPGGSQRTYLYNEPSQICPASMPSACTRSAPTVFRHALTGIVDERNQRFATYAYDDKYRVISSERTAGAGKVTLTYIDNANVDVRSEYDAAGAPKRRQRFVFQVVRNVFKRLIATRDYELPSDTLLRQSSRSFTGDDLTLSTDFRGVSTQRGFLADRTTSITEALSTSSARTTTLVWDEASNRVSSRTMGGQRVDSVFNGRGQISARCEVDLAIAAAAAYSCAGTSAAPLGVRKTTYAYCESADVAASQSTCPILGLLKQMDGPRIDVTDVTSYSYRAADHSSCASSPATCPYRRADPWRVTNALGHIIETVSYDAAGRVTRSMDAGGVITDFTYQGRGWLTHRKVRGLNDQSESDDAITVFEYDLVGNTTRVTQPDGSYLIYAYDGANQLTRITDRTGAYMQFDLDSSGNRRVQKTYTASAQLKHRIAREFDALGRLKRERDALAADGTPLAGGNANDPTLGRLVAQHLHDGNGNRTQSIDGLTHVTDHEFDPLNRLIKTLDALRPTCPPLDSNCGKTEYAYDSRDNLVSVTDPKGLITAYTRDGLNSLTALNSPDTGVTIYASDSAGNRITQTDARSITTTFSYDALNRLQTTVYPSTSLNVTNEYDQLHSVCPVSERFNTGRLSTILDASGSTKFCHDRFGNEVRRIAIIGGVTLVTRSSYDLAGNLTQLIYPSGLVVSYTRDDAARISAVTAGGTLLASASYLPMGPLQNLVFGDGSTLARQYDANYAIDKIDASVAVGLDLEYTTDVTGNITGLTDIVGGTPTNVYSYDPLYRLTQVRDQSGTNIEKYTYDATGNRTSKQVGLGAAVSYTYLPTSHRLSSVGGVGRTYDPVGNTTSLTNQVGNWTLAYDERNRLTQISQAGGGASLAPQYNGLGERVSSAALVHVYARNGQNLADYFGDLTIGGEYVWIDGLLVGYRPNHNFSSAFFYVHSDHLGTPRRIVTGKSKSIPSAMVWDWQLLGNPFGDQPAAASDLCPPFGPCYQVQFNLRFPGQYADWTGLHYNYFRDYDAATGRYTEADPIGLGGGVSLYGYAEANPNVNSDPFGLQPARPSTPPNSMPRQNPLTGAIRRSLANPYYYLHPVAPSPNQAGPDTGRPPGSPPRDPYYNNSLHDQVLQCIDATGRNSCLNTRGEFRRVDVCKDRSCGGVPSCDYLETRQRMMALGGSDTCWCTRWDWEWRFVLY